MKPVLQEGAVLCVPASPDPQLPGFPSSFCVSSFWAQLWPWPIPLCGIVALLLCSATQTSATPLRSAPGPLADICLPGH